jgi:hypothetical protein
MHLREANHSFEKVMLVLFHLLEQILGCKHVWNQTENSQDMVRFGHFVFSDVPSDVEAEHLG